MNQASLLQFDENYVDALSINSGEITAASSSVNRVQGTHMRFEIRLGDYDVPRCSGVSERESQTIKYGICKRMERYVEDHISRFIHVNEIVFSDIMLQQQTGFHQIEGLAKTSKQLNTTLKNLGKEHFLLDIPMNQLHAKEEEEDDEREEGGEEDEHPHHPPPPFPLVCQIKTIRCCLVIKKTEWPRSKTQFQNFLRLYKPNRKEVWVKKPPRLLKNILNNNHNHNQNHNQQQQQQQQLHNESTRWVPHTFTYDLAKDEEIFEYILQSDELSEYDIKELLLDNYDKSKLMMNGERLMKNIRFFEQDIKKKKKLELLKNEKRGCFPIWTQKRLNELATTLSQHICPPSGCEICYEEHCLRILKLWYEEIFVLKNDDGNNNNNNNQKSTSDSSYLIRSDLTRVRKPSGRRLKGLIIRSDREAGKTSWFQAICHGNPDRIAHFKNNFNSEEAQKLRTREACQSIWLILIDDFSQFNKTDLQALKSLLVGEATTINGKWLSLHHQGGIPCVVLCNSKTQFYNLLKDPEINSQCKYIDLLPGMYLGPPETRVRKDLEKFNRLPNALTLEQFALGTGTRFRRNNHRVVIDENENEEVQEEEENEEEEDQEVLHHV